MRLDDPVSALAAERSRLGDTFIVDSGDDRYLFTFSADGVGAFYALDETVASKAIADWRMLRRKLPDEIFTGRRTLPHQLFGREDVAAYLANVEVALDATIEELGTHGVIDVFALTRRVAHRVGLASWGGPGAATGATFERLVAALDTLDGSESFVHPDAMEAVARSGKSAERAALATIVETMPIDGSSSRLFARIAAEWPHDEPDRRAGIAYDVTLIHVASMSNLYAALGWALIDLIAAPDAMVPVLTGDRSWTEQCMLESTRLAQRSIMARFVLQTVGFNDGDQTYEVGPGTTIATLLPLTNTTTAPGLGRWDPSRWTRRRLDLAAPQLVTAFGHGHHTCPAQPFALAAMTATVIRLCRTYRLEPGWRDRPIPVAAQIGGVARAAGDCPMYYAAR